MSDQTLKEFFEFWRDRVDRGKSSGFNRLEVMAIEIYDKWLESRNRKLKREENKRKKDERLQRSRRGSI